MSAKSYICVMEEHVFKQKIRWWKVAVDIFVLSVIAFSIFLMMSTGERGRTYRYGLFVLVGLSALMDLLSMFTTRYVISGDMLEVCHYYPFKKSGEMYSISEMASISVSGNGTLSVRFSNSRRYASDYRLKLSPADAGNFVQIVRNINPGVEI